MTSEPNWKCRLFGHEMASDILSGFGFCMADEKDHCVRCDFKEKYL